VLFEHLFELGQGFALEAFFGELELSFEVFSLEFVEFSAFCEMSTKA
jgi:hypothetical protein